MKYKKKPKLLYLILILIYIIVYVVIFITSIGLSNIYNNILETKTLLLYRDFLRIIIIIEYLTIILTTIRAIGFDLKKFNFANDLNELNIDVTDDEEVELTMGINSHRITQKFNRNLREMKYYIKENKMFVMLILIIAIFLSLTTITVDKQVINKEYKENETFKSDNFNMKIPISYITEKSYTGTIIKENKKFVIVKLNIMPIKSQMSINTGNLILEVNNNKYNLTQKYYNSFKDLGTGYKSQIIKSEKTYILVYEIPKSISNENMKLNYTASQKDLKVNIKPINLDNLNNIKEYKLKENIDFSNSLLSQSNFKINSSEIKNKFTLDYKYIINEQEYTGKKNVTSQNNTIMYLNIDSNYTIDTNNYDFIKEYGQIKYIKDEQEYTNNILNNKSESNKKYIYIEVDKDIENATSIWIEFNIRNASYKYIIK